jgi:hypothetical protein
MQLLPRFYPLDMVVTFINILTLEDAPSQCIKLFQTRSQSPQSHRQCRPLGGASGALAPGADFEGAPKSRSPTGHTLICSTVAWRFPHLQKKRVVKDCFFNSVVLALAYSDVFWCLHMYIHVMLYVYYCKYCWLLP